MPSAGFVTLVGSPNCGKSTLLNKIVGQKLGIVSRKPQSTRDRVVGIVTRDNVQMVLLDTPGLLEPRYKLQRAMSNTALRAVSDADVIVHVVDATSPPILSLADAARLAHPPSAPVITALNKMDLVSENGRRTLLASLPESGNHQFVSALTGEGINELLLAVESLLPESPFLYPDDEVSSQPVRFFVTELVRETALEHLEDEVPYSIACEVEEFRESTSPVYIRAVMYVERASQKAIIIGAKGSKIREIGTVARAKVEEFIGQKVYLDLWVKVQHNWRNDSGQLSRFGYQPQGDNEL